jgi:hypothetical protein
LARVESFVRNPNKFNEVPGRAIVSGKAERMNPSNNSFPKRYVSAGEQPFGMR